MAKDGDQVALAAGFDTQDAEPVLGVVECDALDQTGQDLSRGACPWCLRHRHMMEIDVRRGDSVKLPRSSSSRCVSTNPPANRAGSESHRRGSPKGMVKAREGLKRGSIRISH
jgi:hypothetical protein